MRLILVVTLLLSTPFVAAEAAAGEGTYVGGRFGVYDTEVTVSGTPLGTCTDACDLDFSELSAGAFAGYMFNPFIGLEVTYNRLFRDKDSIVGPSGDPIQYSYDSHNVGVYARPSISAGRVDLYGRLGVEFLKTRTKTTYWSVTGDPTSAITLDDTDKREAFSWALGAQIKPRPSFAIGAEVSRIETSYPVWVYSLHLVGYLEQQ